MKRLLCLVLCCVFALGFAACGDEEETSTPQNKPGTQDGTTEDNYDWLDEIIE